MEQPIGPDLISNRTQPEIRDPQIAVLVEEEILRLEVAVENAARVAVPDGGDQLMKVFAAEILGEATLGDFRE